MPRNPVIEFPMFGSGVPDEPNRDAIVDMQRTLGDVLADMGRSINDDVIQITDWTRAKTAAYTILDTDRIVLVDATSGPLTMTLPSAADAEPHLFAVKKTDASGNAVTVARAGSDTIDGATSKVLSARYELLLIISDKGTAWHVLHLGAP